ncbi:hypothetical protein [Novosphingobium sp.]|uniref:hypothetical protein n=1 Tax=Novosphingobium sp. TaxID=1874826 RepID=UPI0025FA0CA6|nr:hypothetical protein [Novosphingobium sp.]
MRQRFFAAGCWASVVVAAEAVSFDWECAAPGTAAVTSRSITFVYRMKIIRIMMVVQHSDTANLLARQHHRAENPEIMADLLAA